MMKIVTREALAQLKFTQCFKIIHKCFIIIHKSNTWKMYCSTTTTNNFFRIQMRGRRPSLLRPRTPHQNIGSHYRILVH